MCTPTGIECYQRMSIDTKHCLTSCNGLYADVTKNSNFKSLENIEKLESFMANYESYKRGFSKDIEYPDMLSGKFATCTG